MHVVVDKLSVTLQARRVLSDISFMAQRSQTVGLLGPNGSGKSTLIRAMAGVQPCTYAGITMGGKQTNTLSQRQLSRKLAFVPQHAEAEAEMSVLDIVRLGRTPHRRAFTPWHQADEDAVQQALSMMKLNALAHRTWQRLSGGERQRISIARAILKNSPILLLDEATASLDIENELAVKQAIANLLKEKKTVVMIAHTLSIVKNADQILVMGDGGIAESGTHEELLAKGGKYAAMWNAEQKISA